MAKTRGICLVEKILYNFRYIHPNAFDLLRTTAENSAIARSSYARPSPTSCRSTAETTRTVITKCAMRYGVAYGAVTAGVLQGNQ